jgi:maltooligosyltrehalose trehalohydrolase
LDRVAGHEAFRAASLLLLFLPMVPLLFMGQEWAASTPFQYFTDHDAELGVLVREGRRREFAGFHELAGEIPDPQTAATFQRSKLRWSERELPEHRETLELYRAALALRHTDPVLSRSRREDLIAEASDGTLLVHRWAGRQRRVLVLNFGPEPRSLASLGPKLRLRAPIVLLRSSKHLTDSLPPGSASVLGGESDLTGLVEGTA